MDASAIRLTVPLAAPHVGTDVGRRRLSLLPREATTPPGLPHREMSPTSVPAVEARMEQDQVASLLEVFEGGDRDALDRLLPLVYDELRRIAHRELRRERRDHTLSTTEVVHEAYLKLIDHQRVTSGEQVRFLAVAATAVRRALVEHARRRDAAKRGGGQRPVTLDEEASPSAAARRICCRSTRRSLGSPRSTSAWRGWWSAATSAASPRTRRRRRWASRRGPSAATG